MGRKRRTNFPYLRKTCYSKGRLTIHRKQNRECVDDYHAELEQMEIRTSNCCGRIFATYIDMVRRREYHCAQEVNARHIQRKNGIIDRRTPYGYGVPNIDKRLFGEKALFGKITQTWNCRLGTIVETNTDGIKFLAILPQRADISREYIMKGGVSP